MNNGTAATQKHQAIANAAVGVATASTNATSIGPMVNAISISTPSRAYAMVRRPSSSKR
jgi:hypothetical protein